MTNEQLKRIIQKIEVDKEGNAEIFLRLFGDLGLEESILIEDNHAAVQESGGQTKADTNSETTESETLQNVTSAQTVSIRRKRVKPIIVLME